MDTKRHWESVYQTKRPNEVSWFQREASLSLSLIGQVAPDLDAAILDVGGGASPLVDGLLAAGYRHVTVLDVSPTALAHVRQRLGPVAAASVEWIEADALSVNLPAGRYDVWHDRAVFHFLTDAGDRGKYVEQVRRAVRTGGHILVATFADDGPERCSGLPVARYSPEALHREFGEAFRLVESRRETHRTPSGAAQSFVYCLMQFDAPAA